MSVKAETLIEAKRLGIDSSRFVFSRKLEWIESSGRLVLRKASFDPVSRKITIFSDAICARDENIFDVLRSVVKAIQNRTLYAFRPLKNANDVIAWAKQYFDTVIVPEEMHVTVAYSKMVFDWSNLDSDLNDVIVGADTRRSVAPLGDEGAVVLKFKSDEITKCWQRLMDAGASWDYPSYQPHVTLTFNGEGVDLDKIKPYTGELIFGPEVFREITPAGEIEERDFLFRYNPNHEPAGSPDGGQFSSGDGGGDSGGDSGGDTGGGGSAKVSSASELFAKHHDPSITADDVVAKTPGAAKAIDDVMAKLAKGVSTNAPVDEGGFIQKDGTYTPERQALHQQILENIFTPTQVKAATPGPGEKPLLSVLGGRGGSGKSWLTKNKVADPDKAVYLNSDDIQAMLPGQKGWNAALYHEEASDITAKASEIAKNLGLNVIHDATMRSLKGAAARVDEFKGAGYQVNAHYMFLPPHMSTQRGLERFMRGGETGRFVPPAYLMGSTTNEKTFDDLKSKLDAWTIHENMGTSPKLVAQSKNK